MVYCQPWQDALLAFLLEQVPSEVLKPLQDELRIDHSLLRSTKGHSYPIQMARGPNESPDNALSQLKARH